ncbi:hypothetical protein Dimus_024784, partial [Dionaea muscipula]
ELARRAVHHHHVELCIVIFTDGQIFIASTSGCAADLGHRVGSPGCAPGLITYPLPINTRSSPPISPSDFFFGRAASSISRPNFFDLPSSTLELTPELACSFDLPPGDHRAGLISSIAAELVLHSP